MRIAITDDKMTHRCRLIIQLIKLAGAEPVLIPTRLCGTTRKRPLKHKPERLKAHLYAVEELLETCHGVVIPGNTFDVPPRAYGESKIHPETRKRLPKDPAFVRFETEKVMAHHALETPKPLIGICGGFQVLNVVLGGMLCQHIKDDPRVKNGGIHHTSNPVLKPTRAQKQNFEVMFESHLKTGKPENIYPPTHGFSIVEGSLLAKVYREALPNCDLSNQSDLSLHHQGCFEEHLSPKLKAVAWAPDGIVEAIELKADHPFFFATQYHFEQNVGKVALPIFEHFVKALKS